MTQFSDDLTNVAIAGLKSSDEVMHRYSADLIESLKQENAALREQNRKLEMFNQDIVESSKKVQYLNARLVKLLKRLEWQEFGFCPDCENDEDDGHANNCELGNLLAEVRSKK